MPYRLLLAALIISFSSSLNAQPLERYLAQVDSSYRWQLVADTQVSSLRRLQLSLTSQTWREIKWQHDVQIVVPVALRAPTTAFLFVSGSGDGTKELPMLDQIAQSLGIVAIILKDVPNQPLFENLKEDALVAYSFDRYVKTGDESWPVIFPMVKSVQRAMDAAQAVLKEKGIAAPTSFIVVGASKRGWTTWLTAAVDTRVLAIAPMVFDMLNMREQVQLAAASYGAQSEKIRNYTELGLVDRIDEPRTAALRSWVDPFEYLERLKLPKLVLLGSNDPYWVVDSVNLYYSKLKGSTLLHYSPNAGHHLPEAAYATLRAWIARLLAQAPLPQLHWELKLEKHSQLAAFTVKANEPFSAQLWTAEQPKRDFREAQWKSRSIGGTSQSELGIEIARPEQGFRAFFVQLEFKSQPGQPGLILSTAATVLAAASAR
jgi:PhoPQ-activated pathogenicity-related protein